VSAAASASPPTTDPAAIAPAGDPPPPSSSRIRTSPTAAVVLLELVDERSGSSVLDGAASGARAPVGSVAAGAVPIGPPPRWVGAVVLALVLAPVLPPVVPPPARGAVVAGAGLAVVVVVGGGCGQLAPSTLTGAPATAPGTATRGGVPPSERLLEKDQPSTVPAFGVREAAPIWL
jgi:hypothetical protein